MEFKHEFLQRYSKLTDIDEFIKICHIPLRKSLRVNTLKTSIDEVKKRFDLTQVPWCKEGFFIKGYAIGNTKEHFLGYIYIQEAASMIPPIVLEPKKHEVILDMCSSPGSKTTQIAAMMENKGIIVANENSYQRIKPLEMNLERLGVSNTVITLMNGSWFKQGFDKILVDAPCSGMGAIRKSPSTPLMWNPNFIKKLARTQKRLLETAFNCLKEKGTLVYSTCTLEPEENEEVVDYILEKYPKARLEKINLKIKKSEPVLKFNNKEYHKEIENCLRIFPQDNDTEGFFVAKITKRI